MLVFWSPQHSLYLLSVTQTPCMMQAAILGILPLYFLNTLGLRAIYTHSPLDFFSLLLATLSLPPDSLLPLTTALPLILAPAIPDP